MEEPPAIESCSLAERVVLLAITDAVIDGDAPVASVDIRPRCQSLLEHVATEVVSSPGESEVMRALSVLGTEPYVRELRSHDSPTGKGRPQYDLETNPSEMLNALERDDQLADAVEFVKSE